MTLMHGLSEQLEGALHVTSQPGVAIRLVFRDEVLGATYSSTDQTYRWHRSFSALPFATMTAGQFKAEDRWGI
jgi:hypothetical protein